MDCTLSYTCWPKHSSVWTNQALFQCFWLFLTSLEHQTWRLIAEGRLVASHFNTIKTWTTNQWKEPSVFSWRPSFRPGGHRAAFLAADRRLLGQIPHTSLHHAINHIAHYYYLSLPRKYFSSVHETKNFYKLMSVWSFQKPQKSLLNYEVSSKNEQCCKKVCRRLLHTYGQMFGAMTAWIKVLYFFKCFAILGPHEAPRRSSEY